MPINSAHIEFIDAVLSLDLFDELSSNQEKLTEQFEQIKLALALTQEEKDEKTIIQFPYLQRCFHNPKNILNRLEDCGPVKVGEIKKYIIKYVKEKIENVATQMNLVLSWKSATEITEAMAKGMKLLDLKWDPDTIIITETEITESFTSNKVPEAGYSPWDIPVPAGVIYTINNIVLDPERSIQDGFYLIDLSVTLTPSNTENFLVELGQFDFVDNALPPGIVNDALGLARKTAIDCVVTFLVSQKIIDDLEKDQIPDGTRFYLTHRYFLNKILSGKLNVFDIYCDDLATAKKMTSPEILYLLEQELCPFEELLNATSAQLRLATEPYFQDTLKPKDIFQMKDKECSNLTFPPVLNLLKTAKIKTDDAKLMSAPGKTVIASPFFGERITRGEFDFKEISRVSKFEKDSLLAPQIQTLIAANILTVQQAKALSMRQRDLLTYDVIKNLLLEKKIPLDETLRLPYRYGFLIAQNEIIAHFLQLNLLNLCDIRKIICRSYPAQTHLTLAPEPPTSPEDFFILKKMLEDFLLLAQKAILFSCDLNYIYNNFQELKESLAEANQIQPIPLLKLSVLHDRCLQNLVTRFRKIIEHSPYLLHDDKTEDSFDAIKESCEFIQKNFIEFSFEVLLEEMQKSIANFSDFSLEEIVELADELGIKKEKMWGVGFSLRALSIYEETPFKTPSGTDKVEKIIKDMEQTIHTGHLSLTEVHMNFFAHLLKSLKIEILEQGIVNIPASYCTICEKIGRLEGNTLQPQSQQLANWIEIFGNLMSTVHDFDAQPTHYVVIHPSNKKRTPDEKGQFQLKIKRSRVGLFHYEEKPVDRQEELRKLTKNILKLEDLKELFEPKPSQKIGLLTG